MQLCLCIYSRAHAYIHVENVAKEYQMVEVANAEPEYQEQPEEEYVVADQAADQDFTNTETQQGKPRCI